MPEEKKEPWLNYLALTTVILAVCATLATFKGGGHSTRSILRQSQASDTWAFYQAKNIKGALYEIQSDNLQRILEEDNAHTRSHEEALQTARKRIAKYEQEKASLSQEAKRLEAERDAAARHGQAFGLSVIFLQIAILLSSIAALMKKKPLWLAGVAVGVAGLVCFLNGFFLFLH
nr:DUF4337 domain-containing protein [uncultured Holophaga sp.]